MIMIEIEDYAEEQLDLEPHPGFPPPGKYLCGCCYAVIDVLYTAPCVEHPEMPNKPSGLYECPDCGCMLVGGIEHPPVCIDCLKS